MTHQWKLETRVCQCGCGKTFRTLPTSPALYWSVRHMPYYRDPEIEPRLRQKVYKLLQAVYGPDTIRDYPTE